MRSGTIRVIQIGYGHTNRVDAWRKRAVVHHVGGALGHTVHRPFDRSGASRVDECACAIAVVYLHKVGISDTVRHHWTNGDHDVREVDDDDLIAACADENKRYLQRIDRRSGQCKGAVSVVGRFAFFFAIGVGQQHIDRRHQGCQITEIVKEFSVTWYTPEYQAIVHVLEQSTLSEHRGG